MIRVEDVTYFLSGACVNTSKPNKDQSIKHTITCDIPVSAKVAEPGQAVDWEVVDQPMQEQNETIDGQHDILGGQVAAAVGPAGAKQDDHLDKLRQ